MKSVTIYTDGACSGNPGPGGWAAVLTYNGHEKELSGGEASTTNNRMELSAVIAALGALKEKCAVTLYTDSQYIERAINEHWLDGWKKRGWRRKEGPVKNLELMEGDTVEKLTGMRKVVAQRMYTSAVEIPTVTQTVKVDVTALLAFRKKLKEEGHAFSVNDFVLKAVAKALRRHPEILVSLDGEQIIRRAHVNLGMAVALDAGLIVPVIRDADLLSLEALSAKARDLAERARANQLGADEYKGSTFTVSNLGMFGVESFTPIINQPDAAILGVNCTEDELVMEDDGTIAKHQVLRISLTFDHRLLDGAVAAKFEMTVRDLLEHPMDILL